MLWRKRISDTFETTQNLFSGCCKREKSATKLRFFLVSKMQQFLLIFAYAIALTRAARRDILRAAVFL